MIHQLIFAHPRPGMTEAEFQRYWLEEHAVRYASKIPQIRKYMVDTRIPFGEEPDDPPWSGIAEIWLADENEQLASLQTEEFLQGARLDEPRWAAFWRTVVLDTDAHEVVPGDGPVVQPTGVKLVRMAKRREGLPLGEFRERMLGKYADLVGEVPGLRRYLQGHTRDGAYGVGEAVLDVAEQWWFDDVASVTAALESSEFARAQDELLANVEPRYLHRMLTEEHWIIGPDPR